MHILPDPNFMIYYAKHLSSVHRLWKFDDQKLKEFRTKAFKNTLEEAAKTNLYKEKFKKAGVKTERIKKFEDIKKLPFISKQDLRDYSIKDTVPNDFDIKKSFKVDTSGSTGKPVSIYRGLNALALESTFISRLLKAYNLNSLKTKITNVGDFSVQYSYDEECLAKGTFEKMGFFSLIANKKTQHLYAGEKIDEIMKKIDSFQPDMLIAYPGTLIGLMQLRMQGKYENFDPKYVISSGGILDSYTKKQFENAFDTRVLSLYAATESGGAAFECLEGNYHVQSDLVYLEAVDKEMNEVAPGESGHLVVTRLYDDGTPIVRYTGMDDIITPLEKTKCDCGMNSELIKSVEGRSSDSIVLPDGRIFPAATFTLIPGEVAQDAGGDIIQSFQIVQNKIDDIQIRIVINERLKEKVENVDEILEEVKKRYQKLVGTQVNIEIKEIEKISEKNTPVSLSSIVISKVDSKNRV